MLRASPGPSWGFSESPNSKNHLSPLFEMHIPRSFSWGSDLLVWSEPQALSPREVLRELAGHWLLITTLLGCTLGLLHR